ncbi:MAG: ASCH domain-containing protein [Bacteroidales bacterium]|jgi:predicted transcriptional regulator|nr:ASCH domain-containing protein [Bacteroidales bacterium]MEE1226034.1 ASCH domain-containing protein [Bacteroidales bacterium]
MKVLLSIKPEYVEKIFAGTKKYEFRKSLFKKNDVKYVVIYASAPIKRVVGEFEIKNVFSDDVDVIWNRTKKYSGITKAFYESYFQNRKKANAIQIGNIKKYEKTKLLSDYNIKQAPQSFCYIY